MVSFSVDMSVPEWFDSAFVVPPGYTCIIRIRGGGTFTAPNLVITPDGSTPPVELNNTEQPYGYYAALRNEINGLTKAFTLVYVAREDGTGSPPRPVLGNAPSGAWPSSGQPIEFTNSESTPLRLWFQFNAPGDFYESADGTFDVEIEFVPPPVPTLTAQGLLVANVPTIHLTVS